MEKIDLHGKNRYETRVLVENFLYESYLLNRYFVSIIHGHGANILVKEVREILANSPYVKSYEFAPPQYGGAGVTIVYMKSRYDEENINH